MHSVLLVEVTRNVPTGYVYYFKQVQLAQLSSTSQLFHRLQQFVLEPQQGRRIHSYGTKKHLCGTEIE